jgi:hypothetical protein
MRKATIRTARATRVTLTCATVFALVSAPHAQRPAAPPVTDPADPKYLTAQTASGPTTRGPS